MKNMNLQYMSTRNPKIRATASQAVLQGLAGDGGLFVPEKIPALPVSLGELKGMTYQETAYVVMKEFLTDYTEEELKSCIARAYDSKFDTEDIAPISRVDDTYYLELFHGATIAFKDMALSILPHLILTATSGDTGKAAMAGFADVEGTRIIVFYPKGGVSRVQELQMVTQKGNNVDVVAIHGNFDNAQSGVKELFGNRELAEKLAAEGYQFSSANSINIGRLVPQIVYYVYAYGKLLENGEIQEGEKINITVPTGNFGNILAACYAKHMGLPVGKLICASNENKVLFDFFRTGTYDKNREFMLTTSPSMDILVSSNLERLIYQICGRDGEVDADLMGQLQTEGKYTITDAMREQLSDFAAGYATEAETADMIRKTYEKAGYVMDTHTAVAAHVCEQYKKDTGDTTKCLVASTASPYKFVKSVLTAIDEKKYGQKEELELLPDLEQISGVEMPGAIREILDAQVRHSRECDADRMQETVEEILGL